VLTETNATMSRLDAVPELILGHRASRAMTTRTATAAPTVVRTVADLRAALDGIRSGGTPIALVPTMGAFHDGHLSLMRLAGADEHAVVVSLFVNPTQFAPTEDLSTYPRDEEEDLARAGGAGVALVFAPGLSEIYPDGFATTLEGATRPHHFAGVATVVAQLLLAVRPDRVVFGQKDAQQVAVVRRMMGDLHLDEIDLVVGPIVREPDGLAMSSRNAYLSPAERTAAPVLRRALDAATAAVASGATSPSAVSAEAMAVLAGEPLCHPEYAAIVHPDSFEPVTDLTTGPALMCVAARIGAARLIDNTHLSEELP
jgi:pantoate--beta-alanine ligase